MRVMISALLSAVITLSPLSISASSNPVKIQTITSIESILKRSAVYYGELEAFPPNTHPFEIEFTHYDDQAKTFTGLIKYLEGTQTQGQITGSIVGSEMIFTETGKQGVFTLSVQGDHKVKGVWRGNSSYGGEVKKEVWFQTE